MDVSAARLMLAADRRIRLAAGRLVVVRGPAQVDWLLELTGFDRQLELVNEPPVETLQVWKGRPSRSFDAVEGSRSPAPHVPVRRCTNRGSSPRRAVAALVRPPTDGAKLPARPRSAAHARLPSAFPQRPRNPNHRKAPAMTKSNEPDTMTRSTEPQKGRAQSAARDMSADARDELDAAQSDLRRTGRRVGIGAGEVVALGAFATLTAFLVLVLATAIPSWASALIWTAVYATVAVILSHRRRPDAGA